MSAAAPGTSLPDLLKRAARVAALDISPGMLWGSRSGRGKHREVLFLQGDAARLPVRDASFDVVLAAQMLYHVPDIEAAIAEAKRTLRSDGPLLALLNGAADKQELRAVWQEASAAVLGPGARVPAWSSRANLDNMPAVFERHFSQVSVRRRPGTSRFSEAQPALRWIASLRAGTENQGQRRGMGGGPR
jgi:ubiquinone/menaquinone biosynthesis C-methylase UbiE